MLGGIHPDLLAKPHNLILEAQMLDSANIHSRTLKGRSINMLSSSKIPKLLETEELRVTVPRRCQNCLGCSTCRASMLFGGLFGVVGEFLVACEFIVSTAPPRPVQSISSIDYGFLLFLGRVAANYVIHVRNRGSILTKINPSRVQGSSIFGIIRLTAP